MNNIKFTHNEDGSMNINGTGSDNYTTFVLNKTPVTLEAGTYTFAYVQDVATSGDIHFDIRNTLGTALMVTYLNANIGLWKVKELVLEETTEINYVYYVSKNLTVNNQNFKFMVLKGTYTEETLPAYEQYGKTPSIEFESPVENVKAYNLIDFSNPNNITSNTTTSFENNILEVSSSSGTFTSISWDVLDFFKANVGKKIYFKYKNIDISNAERAYVQVNTVIGGQNYYNALLNSELVSSAYTIPNNIDELTYAKVLVYSNNSSNNVSSTVIITEPMLVLEKDKDKLYAPYGSVPFRLQNKNLFDKNDFNEETLIGAFSGKWYKFKPNTKYTVSTNVSAGGENFISPVIGTPISANTYFAITTDKNATSLSSSNNGVYTTSNLTKTVITGDDGFIFIGIRYNSLSQLNTLDWWLQLEEGETATSNITHQEQNYNLHIKDLELNGINDARDSLVIELEDENMSDKKIKKLYLKKKNYKYVFTGNENILIPATPVSEGVKCYKIVLPKDFSNNYVKADCNRCSFLTDSGEWLNASDKTDIAVLSVAAEGPSMYWRVPEGEIPDVTSMSNYLKNNETYIIYPLENTELVDITDNIELVKDVEYLINNFKTFKEVTHVEVENGYIDLEYVKSTELAFKNMQQQIDNIQAVMLEGGTNNA